MNEGFVAVEKTMTPGEQISLKPALAHVFAQHFHDSTVSCEVHINFLNFCHPLFARTFIDRIQAIGSRFVRTY